MAGESGSGWEFFDAEPVHFAGEADIESDAFAWFEAGDPRDVGWVWGPFTGCIAGAAGTDFDDEGDEGLGLWGGAGGSGDGLGDFDFEG